MFAGMLAGKFQIGRLSRHARLTASKVFDSVAASSWPRPSPTVLVLLLLRQMQNEELRLSLIIF